MDQLSGYSWPPTFSDVKLAEVKSPSGAVTSMPPIPCSVAAAPPHFLSEASLKRWARQLCTLDQNSARVQTVCDRAREDTELAEQAATKAEELFAKQLAAVKPVPGVWAEVVDADGQRYGRLVCASDKEWAREKEWPCQYVGRWDGNTLFGGASLPTLLYPNRSVGRFVKGAVATVFVSGTQTGLKLEAPGWTKRFTGEFSDRLVLGTSERPNGWQLSFERPAGGSDDNYVWMRGALREKNAFTEIADCELMCEDTTPDNGLYFGRIKYRDGREYVGSMNNSNRVTSVVGIVTSKVYGSGIMWYPARPGGGQVTWGIFRDGVLETGFDQTRRAPVASPPCASNSANRTVGLFNRLMGRGVTVVPNSSPDERDATSVVCATMQTAMSGTTTVEYHNGKVTKITDVLE